MAREHALVAAIQQALRQRGYNPGPIDGACGPMTQQAIRAFQRDHQLSVDGIAGPMTLGLLGLNGDLFEEMGWLQEARTQIGVAEVIGARSNPVLIAWANHLGLAYQDDRQPWCGLFVAHCIARALPAEPLPVRPLAARSWLKFGQICDPQPGAVMIFWRGTPTGWAGHVGFCVGVDAAAYHVLGGNQGNAVRTVRIARQRLLGARWPKSVDIPVHPGRRFSDAISGVSENEA